VAGKITRDTKKRPAGRRAQFDTTISPIIDLQGAVKQMRCAILCDLVRSRVRLPNGGIHLAELHWYEAAGIGRREFKIKYLLGE
jgi:hypothetical protein